MNRKLLSRLVGSASLLAIAPITAAAAQTSVTAPQSSEPEAANDEIIVTATKRAESLSDVPMSITAASGEALTSAGVVDTTQLVKIVPGFTVNTTQYGAPSYSLRGVGFNEASLGALPSVSVYNDEASLPFAVMTATPIFDLQRVEVLKGPQGTLFGQNATGGAINYVANTPTNSFEAGIRGSYSRFNTIEGQAFVSGPLSDTLAARIAISGARSNPWQYSSTRNDEIGRQRKLAGRAILDWTPSSDLKISLRVSGSLDKSDPQTPQFVQPYPQFVLGYVDPRVLTYPNPRDSNRATDFDAGVDFRRNDRMFQSTLRIDYTLGDNFTLTSLTNFAHMKFLNFRDIDGTYLPLVHYDTRGRLRTFGEELRLSGEVGRFNFIVGANYQEDRAKEAARALFPNFSSAYAFVDSFGPTAYFGALTNKSTQSYRTIAGFANLEYHPTDTITISAGLRYSDVKHRLWDACSSDEGDGTAATAFGLLNGAVGGPGPSAFAPGQCVTAGPNLVPGPTEDSFSENNLSWRGSLNWKATDDLLLYTTVSRGFKSGSYLNASVLDYRVYLSPVKQEKLTSYEAGAKLSVGQQLRFNAAAYYYDFRNKQLLGTTNNPIFGPLPTLVNVPKSRVIGFDLDAVWKPTDLITLTGALNRTSSKIKSNFFLPPATGGRIDDPATGTQDIRGRPFNFAPKWNATFDAEFGWHAFTGINGFFGGSIIYNSKTDAEITDNSSATGRSLTYIKSYATLDLRLGLRSDRGDWEASLFGRNVTSTYYWQNVAHISDTLVRYTGLPASYGISVNYNF
ncbi:MAG TPA: TonB-dependent receptor [Pararhizobium sp.]|nr:TonB-dependent receptor [Pararhizobium sp.]